MTKLTLIAVLLLAPLAARADIGLRLGPEISLAYHDAAGTHAITDTWPIGADVMLSYWLPTQLLSIDLELSENWLGSPPEIGGAGNRIGTVVRPGVRFNPPVLPIYFRGAIPILAEAPAPYDVGRSTFGLRLGAGFTIPLVLFKIYLEGDMDFPLGGGDSAPSAFSNWNLIFTGGVDFRF